MKESVLNYSRKNILIGSFFLTVHCFAFLLLFFPPQTFGQTKARHTPAGQTEGERRGSLNLDAARANPLQLRNFLKKMPKGADLHNHLSGAVYAESWIRAAAEDHLCVNLASLSFARPEAATNNAPPPASCGNGKVPAADAYKGQGPIDVPPDSAYAQNGQHLFDALINAFSMRGFVPSPGVTGHDHFFDTFAKFGATDHRHLGEWLDELATRADAQNEQYLELMHTPEFGHAAAIAGEIGWHDDFAQLRDALLAHGLRDEVTTATKAIDEAEALRRNREHCGLSNASSACRVEIRYLCQVLRGFPKQQVFAQTLLCFETAAADPRFVGVNFVMPEDGYISMSDYGLHMRVIAFLHAFYPKVHVSLHAGELAPGLVPYEGLCCHIRLAVEQAQAERIGHGVDVMYENHPHELLKEMARNHVMVEISLTSNDVILGVSGKDHPFPLYRQFGVPVALATDDEGVSRIDLAHEFVRAVQTYGLSYRDLKQMVRTSLEHSFLPGDSLWRAPDIFTTTAPTCSKDLPGTDKPSSGCVAFLKSSEKAAQQWELERRFRQFESEL
jgi:adenosine deaminase